MCVYVCVHMNEKPSIDLNPNPINKYKKHIYMYMCVSLARSFVRSSTKKNNNNNYNENK